MSKRVRTKIATEAFTDDADWRTAMPIVHAAVDRPADCEYQTKLER